MRKNVELLTGFSNRYDVPEQMTISIGTVFSTGDTRNISLVMTEADKALREAKSEGGNKVIIHHAFCVAFSYNLLLLPLNFPSPAAQR